MRQVLCALCAALFFISGCGSTPKRSKLVVLQNPETLEFEDCKVADGWVTDASYARNEECVEELKKKGYVVWGEH